MYRYKKSKVGDDGEVHFEVVEATFEDLEKEFWQNWADMRLMMRMDVDKENFLSDLKVIVGLEEV